MILIPEGRQFRMPSRSSADEAPVSATGGPGSSPRATTNPMMAERFEAISNPEGSAFASETPLPRGARSPARKGQP